MLLSLRENRKPPVLHSDVEALVQGCISLLEHRSLLQAERQELLEQRIILLERRISLLERLQEQGRLLARQHLQ